MTQLIDGKALASSLMAKLKNSVAQQQRQITLAVVQVGDDPASTVYIRNKHKACEKVGIRSLHIHLEGDITSGSLLDTVHTLNSREDVDGILVQLPLPSGIDEGEVIRAIDPAKDVDGFHPINIGRMMLGEDCLLPCTPAGIIALLKSNGVDINGKECVVVGRSNIVGKPVAQLLLQAHGTVTQCHSRTRNLAEVCRRADILVAAVGVPRLINADFVKPGAVVIDVGIHRMADNTLCGDVDFDSVKDIVGAITPVPGGVGPMTIAMLMQNCVRAGHCGN
ncbi:MULTISPECIES: bifunctional methylenetetrahydrofolate dehydrogenase/methenyltetrahydrofolate cyclohydrolase FolD [Tenebrionibacter/Tenebrionicola group]|jgi:methylenetetrahydrofolate dehydrogenase (NADP+)/methenyltetrahydrofolate cyclohydrolase|uniref:Bifunctional protein FolD n=2 Tax=Tenebrionibacter/Tenebrionicola group TaxID=2969848 RepID=A0A8K0V571_9ENTR|nr:MULTISPECIES: bifunctional methylenetetrahydrofolate dehydrogenase/methenyltetrahydrofolate cyclohydrolase FolD [Tenebrionibacter/Tenebrionicola group]MBK4714340.1 bifunctional methylenetetrahydrofolate dehydrogenase/methenyltetrahydrofolate cyclohydrolase FolD [Tenebrionibacter intestinalis]MBV5095253.1 bifunctional methylenetetrahydrofolate dehydrogenase/methenyltetrahydrofolate cyclohydrolase FolD [Tenebrionicola larvae]